MSALSVRIPNSMHEQLREIAAEEGISINQFVMLAIAEKIATLTALDYLAQRAKRGSREKLLAALDAAPDEEPEARDRLQP